MGLLQLLGRTMAMVLLLIPAAPALVKADVGEPRPIVDLGEIVVTATGYNKEAFDTPLPTNVIDSTDIARRLPVSIADLLVGEPGVDVSTTGTGSIRPMIRGLCDERVLILVDGIRLSEQRPGGNHILSLDPAQIERIEILRGPASVLYGSDAIGGVMNVITKKGDEETRDAPRARLEQDYTHESASSGWTEMTHFNFGRGRVNFYVGGSYKDTENIQTPEDEVPHSFYDGGTLWGGAHYVGDRWKARLGYSYMESDIGVPGPPVFIQDYFQGEKHHMWTFASAWSRDEGLFRELKIDAGFQRHNRHRYRLRTPPPSIAADLKGDLEVQIWLDIDTYTFQPQLLLRPSASHTITTGAQIFYEDASSDRTIKDTDSTWVHPRFHDVPVIPDSRRLGAGFFAQDEITLGDRLVVTPGVRYDYINAETDGHPRHQQDTDESVTDQAFSGNLGVLVSLTDQVNLYGNAGRAFRAPTLLERFFDGPHDVKNDIGNPDLNPETSLNLDVGLKARFSQWQGTFSVFHNSIEDYITKVDVDSAYAWKNFQDATLYGAEIDLEYAAGAGISLFGTLSCVRGEYQTRDPGSDVESEGWLPCIPPLKGRYGIRYDYDFNAEHRLWTEFSGLSAAMQKHAGAGEKETPAWTRVDIRAACEIGTRLSVVAAVENLTDVLYHDHLSRTWQSFDLNDQAGRNVKVMASLRL